MRDAHLADPNRLWPSGIFEYNFYRNSQGASDRFQSFCYHTRGCLNFSFLQKAQDQGEEKVNVENKKAVIFQNVKVFATDPWQKDL